MDGKRPPAYSDSFIELGTYKTLDSKPLVINIPETYEDVPTETPVHVRLATISAAPAAWITCEKICESLLRFLFHITLISIFETVFFFHFVSKDEDAGILGTTNFYTNSILDRCAKFSLNETAVANYLLGPYVNASAIINAGIVAGSQRTALNASLNALSWTYVGILAGLMGAVTAVSVWRKYKIHWLYIVVENIVLVTMLGLYEFMFFETIIKKYTVESPQEISGLFVQGLQKRCGLLT
jgi:hypothetical protein